MTTPAEQEAERRFPFDGLHPESPDYIRAQDDRVTFMWGAEWAWENPPDHIRELLEAAEAYRDVVQIQDKADADLKAHPNDPEFASAVEDAYWKADTAINRLMRVAAALPGDS